MNVLQTVGVVAVAGLAIYVWRVPLGTIYTQTLSVVLPCRNAIHYTLGTIDPQFGLSTSTALADMKAAAELWNDAAARPLLLYDNKTNGAVVINFEYDTRQATTEKLHDLDITLKNDRSSYDALKTRYERIYADYVQQKRLFATEYNTLQKEISHYKSDVAQWNARGGAPRNVYDQLQAEQARLADKEAYLQRLQDAINTQVATINTLAVKLNDLTHALNLDVSTYNTIGRESGSEFEQGVYESSLGRRSITIFEYDTHVKLVRVLAHEMGHAIGLEHVADTDAIMAPLNHGSYIKLTAADITELDAVCSQSPLSILKAKLSQFLSPVSTGKQ